MRYLFRDGGYSHNGESRLRTTFDAILIYVDDAATLIINNSYDEAVKYVDKSLAADARQNLMGQWNEYVDLYLSKLVLTVCLIRRLSLIC